MSDYAVDILVRNKAITKYQHEGNLYVEGRAGSEFIVRVSNNSSQRILAILSVDGLSVMDGKKASYSSGGYVIDPFSNLKIPGWRLDDDSVAKFRFSKKGKSYAKKSGTPENIGVIGCAVFKEKSCFSWVYANPMPEVTHDCTPQITWTTDCSSTGKSRSAHYVQVVGEPLCDTSTMTVTTTNNLCDTVISSSTGEVEDATVSSTQNIGTEFGEKSSHQVNTIDMDAEDYPATIFSIHYDDREGLKARGIDISRKVKIANPFPAESKGCEPPKNWRG